MLPTSSMIPVEEARDRILAYFSRLQPERKPLLEALGQVLAQDITAPFDIPPLDNTAMDG
ncbi:MAG: molybdopterin molybdenumtransferase MoeA, partial [Chloroflexota bacterium]